MLKTLAVASALATTSFLAPAEAAATAAVLTCDLHVQAFGGGEGTCNLTGVAGGTAWALQVVAVDLFGVVGGLCGVNGSAVGHLAAPVNADFQWTWVGPLGVMTLSGGTTGVGLTQMVLVAGNPCFSPELNYTVVMELAGI